jgi:hypothetical protein
VRKPRKYLSKTGITSRESVHRLDVDGLGAILAQLPMTPAVLIGSVSL